MNEIKNDDGSSWVIERIDGGYNVKYTNVKGEVYNNSTIVTSDIEGSNLFLDAATGNFVNLVMDYTKDVYIFKFSSGYSPDLLSACKKINLPSVDQQQAVAQLTLCSRDNVTENMTLSNTDVEKLFSSNNLMLVGNTKTLIGNDKAFLYDGDKKQRRNKPYLVKGDVVEILEYKNSMLKIKYLSKSNTTIAWIKFVDIL